jgi:xylulokinase
MYLLGIDLGTTNVKTLIWDVEKAAPAAAASQEYPVQQPQPGYAEQNPDDWWQAVVQTVQQAVAQAGIAREAIAGIGLSGQMHGFVCIDAQQRPVRPAIIWADTRSKPQVDALLAQIGLEQMADHAPGLPAAGFMAPTLMWLRLNEPHTLKQTQAVLLPKDYIRLQLTGSSGTDASDAAATWLFDVRSGQWSPWLVEQCGLDARYLPPVSQSGEIIGTVSAAVAAQLGLRAGIPVIAGCADQPAQALGYGLYQPGTALVTVGTGGQVLMPLTTPRIDPQLRYYVFNHALPERWYAAAAILSAGLALRWLRDMLGLKHQPDAYIQLSALAAQTPPGADGMIFLPYLAGERTPHMDPLASGLFLGLRLHHQAGHLARAVMEGVTFALAECLDLVTALDQPDHILISGGAVRSPVWRQIQADVFRHPLRLARGENHACIGTALLAGVACGLYESIEAAADQLPQPSEQVEPDQARAAFYAERRTLYSSLYPRLKDAMHTLSAP